MVLIVKTMGDFDYKKTKVMLKMKENDEGDDDNDVDGDGVEGFLLLEKEIFMMKRGS